MDDQLILKNRLKAARAEKGLSQGHWQSWWAYRVRRSARSRPDSSIRRPSSRWFYASRWTKNLKTYFILRTKRNKKPPRGAAFSLSKKSSESWAFSV